MKFRSPHGFILIGLVLLIVGIVLQLTLRSPASELKPLDSSTLAILYHPGGNSTDGNPNGTVTLVDFFDYNCKYCRKFHPKLKQLIKDNPDLRIIYKEFLLFGPSSLPATSAVLAAQKQGKYLQLQEAFLNATSPLTEETVLKMAQKIGLDIPKLKADMSSESVQAQITENNQLAKKLEFDGAPIFIVTRSDITEASQKHIPQHVLKTSEGAEPVLSKWIQQSRASE